MTDLHRRRNLSREWDTAAEMQRRGRSWKDRERTVPSRVVWRSVDSALCSPWGQKAHATCPINTITSTLPLHTHYHCHQPDPTGLCHWIMKLLFSGLPLLSPMAYGVPGAKGQSNVSYKHHYEHATAVDSRPCSSIQCALGGRS